MQSPFAMPSAHAPPRVRAVRTPNEPCSRCESRESGASTPPTRRLLCSRLGPPFTNLQPACAPSLLGGEEEQ